MKMPSDGRASLGRHRKRDRQQRQHQHHQHFHQPVIEQGLGLQPLGMGDRNTAIAAGQQLGEVEFVDFAAAAAAETG